MTDQKRISEIAALLTQRYPTAECALEYKGSPWKLLVMGRLSAQCTDKRVNAVCEELFDRFPTPEALAAGELSEIERIVKPCGLYKVKAQNIKDECAMLVGEFGGIIPREMESLLRFPGVGRKIANLLRGDLYHLPAVVADTHCIRITSRLGFTPADCKDPLVTERAIAAILEPTLQSDFCHRIVLFGREICTARSPKCAECELAKLCRFHKTQAGQTETSRS